MTAAFWLPSGTAPGFESNCAVVQWVRGEMRVDGELLTCSGPDCIYDESSRREWCPPRGNCQTLSSTDWHIDQWHYDPAAEALTPHPYTDPWKEEGFTIPDSAPGKSLLMRDEPTVRTTEAGHTIEANVEFVIAVYDKEDLAQLPAYGGGIGNPYGSPVPRAIKEWTFKTEEPYVTR